jgi:hypothetical protein
MNKKMLLIALLVVGLVFLASSVFAQSLPSGYDEDEEIQTISTNAEGAGTTFVQDLEVIRRRRINAVIEEIRQGDPNTLRFIVYDVMEEVQREAIRRAREGKSNFYAVLNMNNAIPAFIGGFDNQDPRVRLRCIGFLGDWVDEIGTDLADIQKRTRDRIVSRIETREEVKYGLRLLDLKISRKTILNRIFQGDEKILEQITAMEFIPLVHDELFLREVYCIPRDVLIRSIRLVPWWIDIKVLNAIVAERLRLTQRLNQVRYEAAYSFREGFILPNNYLLNREEEEMDKMNDSGNILPLLPTGTDVYRLKTEDDDLADGQEFETLKTFFYKETDAAFFTGYYDWAGRWDIQSLYDIRYFNYSQTGLLFDNEDKLIRALFGGLRNRHLVVRENCARVIVMLSDPYVRLDLSGRVVGCDGLLDTLSKESKYVETAINAWEEVRFAQFVDVARPSRQYRDNATQRDIVVYYQQDGTMIDYNTTYNINRLPNPWGYVWNYRIDMYEILRRMGYGQLFACDIEEERVQAVEPVETDNTYFVESLFDLSTIDVQSIDNTLELIPSWHGVDEIEDEIFSPNN